MSRAHVEQGDKGRVWIFSFFTFSFLCDLGVAIYPAPMYWY